MEPVLILTIIISFFVTLSITPIWITNAKRAGLVGKNMNKLSGEKVAEAGGVPVLMGFVLGLLFLIAINTFIFNSNDNLIEMFALLGVILIISFIGFLDDLLGWKIGLNKKTRIFLILVAAIPLIVINAGESNISLPFLGVVSLGLIYPLILIPLGIIGASTTYNFLAGYNGLEASQGILVLSALAVVTWLTGNSWLSVIALCMVASLFAFYFFNKYPAKIFPGDVMTYQVGALIAIVAILGNIERIAVFFFIPYIIETGLKLRGGLKKQSFGKANRDGSLEAPFKKVYGLEHIAILFLKKIKMSGKAYETEVVFLINTFQVAIIILGLIIFRDAIFLI